MCERERERERERAREERDRHRERGRERERETHTAWQIGVYAQVAFSWGPRAAPAALDPGSGRRRVPSDASTWARTARTTASTPCPAPAGCHGERAARVMYANVLLSLPSLYLVAARLVGSPLEPFPPEPRPSRTSQSRGRATSAKRQSGHDPLHQVMTSCRRANMGFQPGYSDKSSENLWSCSLIPRKR